MAIERSVRINIQTRDAQRNLQSLNRSFEDTDRNAAAASRATLALTGAVAGLVSAASVREIGRYADTYTGLQNQLRLVTDSSDELATANERLLEIAQATRGGLEGTVDLYARLSRSTDSLGVSSDRLFNITQSVNQAIAVSGTSAASAQAALFQLGQGLSAGALRGDELNSVLEQTPRLATAIADGLGVTIGELRLLGAEGQLTAERVVEALESQAEVLEREYARTSSTISQAFTTINNQLITYIGNADRSTGATERFTDSLNFVSENFTDIADGVSSVLVPALVGLATVYGGRLAGSVAQSTTVLVRNTQAQIQQAAAARQSAVDQARSDNQRAAAARVVTEADLRRAATNQQVAATEVSRLRAVEQGLIAERLTEQSRLAAQISDRGRQLSLTRLSEIEISRRAILGQLATAENSLAAATTRTTQAYAANAAAGQTANATNASLQRGLAATTTSAIATRGAFTALNGALSFIGGPAGAAAIAVSALALYITSVDDGRRTTDELSESVSNLGERLNELSVAQATVRLFDLRDEIEELEIADRAARGLVETLSVRADRGFAVSAEENARAIAAQEESAEALNNALRIQADLQSIVNGTFQENVETTARSVTVNTSLANALQSARSSTITYEEATESATFSIGRLTNSTSIAADRLAELNDRLNPGQSQARQYSAFIQELTERLNPAGVQLQNLREQVEFTNAAYNQGVLTYSQYREELDRLDAQILDVELAHTRNNQATDESSDTAERATQSQSALSQALVVAGQSAEASSRQLDTATEATRRLVEETQRLSTTTSSISSTASFADLDSDSQAAFRARARGQLNQSSFGGTPSAAAIEQLATQLFIEATGGSRGRFANGGQFMVGGSGGTDSQRVTFDASPDERVTIETPAQQRQSRGVVVQSLTIQAQDRSIEEVFIELQQLQLQSGVMLDQTRGTIS